MAGGQINGPRARLDISAAPPSLRLTGPPDASLFTSRPASWPAVLCTSTKLASTGEPNFLIFASAPKTYSSLDGLGRTSYVQRITCRFTVDIPLASIAVAKSACLHGRQFLLLIQVQEMGMLAYTDRSHQQAGQVETCRSPQ